MTQSKSHSLVESLTNTAVGYLINLVAQIVIFPLFGVHIGLRANIGIGLAFTVISVVRGYCLRRAFNWITKLNEAVP